MGKNSKESERRRRLFLIRTVLPLVTSTLMFGVAISFIILSAIIKNYELLISAFIISSCFLVTLLVILSEVTYEHERERKARLYARKEKK